MTTFDPGPTLGDASTSDPDWVDSRWASPEILRRRSGTRHRGPHPCCEHCRHLEIITHPGPCRRCEDAAGPAREEVSRCAPTPPAPPTYPRPLERIGARSVWESSSSATSSPGPIPPPL